MKMKAYKNPVTIGKLVQELKPFDKKYSTYDVACWTPDDSTLCVVGAGLDKDGDLRIELDEMGDEGGGFSVSDLLAAIKEYDKETKVYMAGCGMYLNFEPNHDGSIFSDASEEDEVVGCHAVAFGKYKEEKQVSEVEKRGMADSATKQVSEQNILTIALAVMIVAIASWLIYNVYALIVQTGDSIWENIMWIVICVVLLAIDILTLRAHKK